jgi:hypothetical protein
MIRALTEALRMPGSPGLAPGPRYDGETVELLPWKGSF